jgi:hypothetical protein
MKQKRMSASPFHFSCCLLPIFSNLFWFGALLSVVCAWLAGEGTVWGWAAEIWYVNALALGILSIGAHQQQGCKICNATTCRY